ncbi:nucleophile aminohydrolase [Lasiosphaeria ovina]|uniref:Nucleophile aminohydrolase n=1 Tax=Lasiosphaeria ovina TaxID=92902 RepID=A0AAE0NJP0_9PEZI|nr:nucleophile aminohydrolase [Lasiosphaeria ovina]
MPPARAATGSATDRAEQSRAELSAQHRPECSPRFPIRALLSLAPPIDNTKEEGEEKADRGGAQTSIGTGYDLANSIFSPDGRNFQVEYAVKAVENGGTSIGIRCKDGVVLAVEKVVTSKLLKQGANKRIATVDRHLGVVYSGMIPDGRHFIDRARDESRSWRDTFKTPMPTADLASRMGGYMQAYTLYQSVRPFGITAIVGGFDSELEAAKYGGPFLYMIEPSGLYWGYYGAATGKGRQAAKAELEKLDLSGSGTLSLLDAVKEAARIIYVAHDDNKDKEFELEMSWISGADGPTKGLHQEVPKALREEAERLAKKSLEDEDDDDEKKDDDKMQE